MKVCIFFMLFVPIMAEKEVKKCSLENVLKCGLLRNKFSEEYKKPFPSTKKELARQCELSYEMIDCGYNYSQTCLTSMDKIIGQFVLSGTIQKIKDLCNPEHRLHKDYLKDSECMVNNYGLVKDCINDITAAVIQTYKEKSGNKLLVFCCGINRMRECIADRYEGKCSSNAVFLVELQIELIITEFIFEICNPYLEVKNDCPPLPATVNVEPYKNYYIMKYVSPFLKY
ncbi:uncharacterized protein [Centruroides vittatus]|uniref:uncharacterized protein isoform X2 n=1 Tax=Centruroides vittatus TaxID=120091 RepID=UPI00350EB5BF